MSSKPNDRTKRSTASPAGYVTHALKRLARYVAIIFIAMITLVCFVAVGINHFPISTEVKNFVSNDVNVASLIGPIESDDVRIHQLNIAYSNASLALTAVAVASGPFGQLQIEIEGERLPREEVARFRLGRAQLVRCDFIYACSEHER